jgi:hypothetical protein
MVGSSPDLGRNGNGVRVGEAVLADMYFLRWWAEFSLTPVDELVSFLAVLEAHQMAPTHYGTPDGDLWKFSSAGIKKWWKKVEGNPAGLVLRRNKAPKYEMDVVSMLTHSTFQSPAIDVRTKVSGKWPKVLFAMHQGYSQHLRPFFAALVPHFKKSGATWTDRAVANITTAHLRKNGLPPVGARTWFGPHAVREVGRDLILGTPDVVVREQDDGAIEMDLADEPWTLDGEQFLALARAATSHLMEARPFGDYSEPGGTDKIRTHLWTPPQGL